MSCGSMSKKRKDFFALMVLGPPGSGKGTQIKLLSKKLGLFHLITSKLARDRMRSGRDKESLEQKKRYASGLLCKPEWILKIVKEKIEEILNHKEGCRGIIFDGSPRTLYEAKNLYNFLVKKTDKKNIKVIEIDVSEQELRKRVKKRKRDIDKEEIFNVRIKVYKKETLPGLKFLKKKHGIIVIDGDQSVEGVHKEVMRKLGLWQALNLRKK